MTPRKLILLWAVSLLAGLAWNGCVNAPKPKPVRYVVLVWEAPGEGEVGYRIYVDGVSQLETTGQMASVAMTMRSTAYVTALYPQESKPSNVITNH